MVKTQLERCAWCGDDPLYVDYHDEEWGVPEFDNTALFERLLLEGMQAGLSWFTVLKKREHMRKRFFDFEPERLARAGAREMKSWLEDPGLIRNRAKLDSVVGNARATLALSGPSKGELPGGGLSKFVWSFVGDQPVQNRWLNVKDVPGHTSTSVDLSTALKKAGFKFVGPTICYAFMQSAGLVNDHLLSCPSHQRCAELGVDWKR